MLPQDFHDRSLRLIDVGLSERRQQLPLALKKIDADCAAKGALRSGSRLLQIHQAIARDLEVRAVIVWRSLVRVHQTFGTPPNEALRTDLKEAFYGELRKIADELNQILDQRITEKGARDRLTLDQVLNHCKSKHDVEIDLFVDSLETRSETNKGAPMTQTYNFYGAIGAVQSGPSAVANVVQNLSADDKGALIEALGQVRAAIAADSELADQRQELIEIADECSQMVQAAAPNNSKLRGMFEVLSLSIQTIAGVQPAYQALKVAVLPLGITLP